jgi:hypothetical protein
MMLSPTDVSAFPQPHSNPNYEEETPIAWNLPNEDEKQGLDDTNLRRALTEFVESNPVDSLATDGFDRDSLADRSADVIELHDGSSSYTIDSSSLSNSTFVQRSFDAESVPNPSKSIIVTDIEETLIQEIRLSPGTMKEKIAWILHNIPRVPRPWSEETFLHCHQGERQEETQLHTKSRIDLSDQSVMDDLALPDLYH